MTVRLGIVVWVFLALLAAVVVARAGRLVAGRAFDAPHERRWFAWAYRHPDAGELLRAAASCAEAFASSSSTENDERVRIVVPRDPWWWEVMWRYHVPERSGVVSEESAARGGDSGSPRRLQERRRRTPGTTIWLSGDGFEVWRDGRRICG